MQERQGGVWQGRMKEGKKPGVGGAVRVSKTIIILLVLK